MIVGERVAERLRAEGLSQAELARRVGVSQPSIFKLIHENKTGSSRIHVVARELRTTPAYLMGETDDPYAEMPDERLTSEQREWLGLLEALAPKDRQAVMTLTRSLASSAPGSVHAPGADYRTEG